MLSLDMRTVLVGVLLGSLVCAIVMVDLWRLNRGRVPGVGLWLADFLLQTIAAVILALRGPIPEGLSIALGCPLIVGGTVLLTWGMEDYTLQKRGLRAGFAFFVPYLAFHLYFAFVQPDMAVRTIAFSLALTALTAYNADLLLRRVRPGLRAETRRVGITFLLIGVLSAMRASADALGPASVDMFSVQFHDVVVVLLTSLLYILLTFSIILMVNRRLAAALEADLAQLGAASQALRESEEKFSRAFKTSPFAIAISRASDGKYLEFNDALCSLIGYSRAEIAGANAIDLGLWADPAERARWVARLAEGQPISGAEVAFRGKGGRIFTGLLSSGSLTLKGEDCILSVIIDMSESKRVAKEQERLKEELAQSQKLESIGQLAGGVAHDFNNMLTVILGHTEFAMSEVERSHPVSENLREIGAAAERSAELTRQLLAFARKQPVLPQVLDLDQAVDGALGMLRRLVGEDLEIAWAPGSAGWKVRMDPIQVEQVLANLCVNAHDAMEKSGKVSLRTECAVVDALHAAKHAGALAGDYVVLTVSDQGSGMDAETLAHAFEPFFTTKATGKGTGLGLATVHGIVHQNRGFIEASSVLGMGTVFQLHLPRYTGGAAEADGGGREAPVPRGQECLLLVEDDPNILKLTARMLEGLGYEVHATSKSGEAGRLAAGLAGRLKLLVTDVVMPEVNGQDLAKDLQAAHPGLRCLFVSGYTAEILDTQKAPAGGFHFLRKPFTQRALAHAVREALAPQS